MKQTYAYTIYLHKNELEQCLEICKSKVVSDFRFTLNKALERLIECDECEVCVHMDFVKVDNGSQTSGA